MRRALWICVPAAMLLALWPAVAAAKTAAGPSCGATITKSITLKANLNCSSGGMNGLNVGKSGIVINLNGHTITGAGGADDFYGIFNNGHANVTVENGTIKNFRYDYFSQHAHHETVMKIKFMLDGSRTYFGLYAANGGGSTYSHNTVSNAEYGFETYSAAGDVFMHNTLTGNMDGAYEEYSQHDTWTSNTFSYSSDQGYSADDGSPILIGNVSNHDAAEGFYLYCNAYGNAVVKNNTATHDGKGGIYSYYCYTEAYQPSTFTGNTTNHDSYGIESEYDWRATFSGNTADDNTDDGFYFYYPVGYVIRKNTSNNNGIDGVYLFTNAEYFPTLFAKNSSSGNNDYGFESDSAVFGTGDSGSGNKQGLFYLVSG
jgi:Right handed beta helix region/Periplasmic copper-binding protein (NosD)